MTRTNSNENPNLRNLKHTQNPRAIKSYQGTSCDVWLRPELSLTTAAMTLHSKRKLSGTRWYSDWNQTKLGKGNSLTFHQVYDLAKTEESTQAQMQAITQGNQAGTVHSVRRKQKSDTPRVWTDVSLIAPVWITASMTRNAKFHLQTSTSSKS